MSLFLVVSFNSKVSSHRYRFEDEPEWDRLKDLLEDLKQAE